MKARSDLFLLKMICDLLMIREDEFSVYSRRDKAA
jgi:hypothetical protein